MNGISNLLSSLITLLKGLDSSGPGEQSFRVGQNLKAQVLSKEGPVYHLQIGDKSFTAQAATPLEIGRWVKLTVLGMENNQLLLKKTAGDGEDQQELRSDGRKLMEKFGVTRDTDCMRVESTVKQLPVAENTAIRYLLDPHLLAAVITQQTFLSDNQQRIEVYQYHNGPEQEKALEIRLDLDLENLGHLEVSLRMAGESIYTRIWAPAQETEELLQKKIRQGGLPLPHVEIIPFYNGPLLTGKNADMVDMKV